VGIMVRLRECHYRSRSIRIDTHHAFVYCASYCTC